MRIDIFYALFGICRQFIFYRFSDLLYAISTPVIEKSKYMRESIVLRSRFGIYRCIICLNKENNIFAIFCLREKIMKKKFFFVGYSHGRQGIF